MDPGSHIVATIDSEDKVSFHYGNQREPRSAAQLRFENPNT